MKKVVLVDGNNLMFRSYFATLYSGSTLRNKKGFPTNAIYGFVNMINKIISEEKPMYIAVAFDIGKTFRHEKYDYYKGKRDNTPDELKEQFPIAKQILTAMNIKYFELQGCRIVTSFEKYIFFNVASLSATVPDNVYVSPDKVKAVPVPVIVIPLAPVIV